MGHLSPERIQCNLAFMNTAVDLAGHFFIRKSDRRNARMMKYYIALFCCMSTKSLHTDVPRFSVHF